ncbi:serine hydrolase [Rhodanobacter glycinis]|nr:serine hydrolase [Rhodanobacter glycinis]
MGHSRILTIIGLMVGFVAPGVAVAGSPSPSLHGDMLPRSAVMHPAPSAKASDWQADIRQHAQRLIDAGFFPGMSLAVTRGDQVVYVGSFGIADVDSGRRVDDHTRFYIASTTKALTATAVVLRASRGALQLDAPVTRYLRNLEFKAPLQADAITLRDLLSMTDGIDDCLPVVFRTAFTGVFTQPGLMALMKQCGPAKTGRAFDYRNLPYHLLGMVLAPAAANGWKAVVRADVLVPLGMDETSARLSTLDPGQIAMPHEATGDGFMRIRLGKVDANLHAAGGYFTTARDLARFVAVHAADGMLDGQRIFPAGVLASTQARHADQDHDFGPYHRFGWGFGWDLGTFEGHTLVHRFGSFAGYRSHVSFMPDTRIGVVVLVNGMAEPFAADDLADYIYDRLNGTPSVADTRYARAFKQSGQRKARYAEHLRKQQAIQRARQQQPLAHPLAAYAGRYANPQLGTMAWRVTDDHLDVSIGAAQSRASIYAAAKNQMRVELTGSGEVVTFRFPSATGPADSLKYSGYRFERQ